MAQLIFQYSLWWLLPIVALAGASAWVLYGNAKNFTKSQRGLLASLRFLLILVIGILLLSPMLKRQTESTQKPILVWMQDVSASLLLQKDSTETKNWLQQNAPKVKAALSEKFEVVEMPFAETLENPDSVQFTGVYTDISSALQAAQSNYYNQYVGGLVLLSDGIYNKGSNPQYSARYFTYPVQTVLMGDSIQYADARIAAIQVNDEAYLQNEFAVGFTIETNGLSGKRSVVTVKNQEGETLFSEPISVAQNQQSFTFQYFIQPKKAGLRRFSIAVNPLGEEENTANNAASFTININNQQKQVGFFAHAPHPDIYAIKAALAESERYKINLILGDNGLQKAAKENDLFILHQPSAVQLQAIAQTKKAYWLINGPEANAGAVNQQLGAQVSAQFEPTLVKLNTGFTLFALPSELESLSSATNPLLSPFGKLQTGEKVTPLFYKKVGSVVTADPLWYYTQKGKIKTTVTHGINFWRWRVEDYRVNGNQKTFDELIQSTLSYLSLQESEQRFTLNVKRSYSNREDIRLKANVLNQSGQLSQKAEVKLQLLNEAGEQFDYAFNQNEQAYSLVIKPLPAGVYSYSAQAKLGDETFVKKGAFEVKAISIEARDLTARFGMLRNLANETGGKAYTLATSQQLVDDLLNSNNAIPQSVFKTETKPLISIKLFFFILLTFVGLEWVLRKYFGKY